jgi:hypothetical protein
MATNNLTPHLNPCLRQAGSPVRGEEEIRERLVLDIDLLIN